jgi:hypothetical protein
VRALGWILGGAAAVGGAILAVTQRPWWFGLQPAPKGAAPASTTAPPAAKGAAAPAPAPTPGATTAPPPPPAASATPTPKAGGKAHGGAPKAAPAAPASPPGFTTPPGAEKGLEAIGGPGGKDTTIAGGKDQSETFTFERPATVEEDLGERTRTLADDIKGVFS